MLCWEKGAKIRVAPVDDFGQVRLDEYQKLFNSRTRLVSFTHVSNALGTVTPAKDMIEIARRYNVKVLLDGAQSVSHKKVDVQELDPDFFVFSGHKIFGPTGIGALYGKPEVLNAMQPWQGGGNMIADVTFERTLFQPAPLRFEAGTGNIADAVGLAAALEYVERIGLDKIDAYEHSLVEYATHHLSPIPGLTIVGRAKEKASVVSFVLDGYKSEEVGAALNAEGIAVRSGHHCAQPILRRFGYETTVRPSFAFYNTCGEIDVLVDAVEETCDGKISGWPRGRAASCERSLERLASRCVVTKLMFSLPHDRLLCTAVCKDHAGMSNVILGARNVCQHDRKVRSACHRRTAAAGVAGIPRMASRIAPPKPRTSGRPKRMPRPLPPRPAIL